MTERPQAWEWMKTLNQAWPEQGVEEVMGGLLGRQADCSKEQRDNCQHPEKRRRQCQGEVKQTRRNISTAAKHLLRKINVHNVQRTAILETDALHRGLERGAELSIGETSRASKRDNQKENPRSQLSQLPLGYFR